WVMAIDVGAIGFTTLRPIFDLVWLVKNGEVSTYMVGPGAVFERLERLAPGARPAWLAIYPDWLGLAPLLGERLFVPDTIPDRVVLGNGYAAIQRPAWGVLGSGAPPAGAAAGAPVVDHGD